MKGAMRLAPLLLAGLLAFLVGSCGGKAPRGPNLLVITLDTTRVDVLSCYGFPLPSTPNLDELAQHSLLFEHAVAPMPQTLPSHSTLFTGLSPRRHGAVENAAVMSADVQTVAELLHERGWETAGFIGALVLEQGTGIEQGFEVWDQPTGVQHDSQHPVERRGAAVTDSALYWAGRREDEQRPFLLWVHYYDAHGPYDAPQERLPLAGVRTLVEERDRRWPGKLQGQGADMAGLARLWHDYVNEVAEVDAQVGRLLDGLRARGLLENTAILVVGDHGEGLMEHGEKSHGVSVYEELMHVPLLLQPPKPSEGRRVAEPIAMQDVMPTLLQASGLPPLAEAEGRSRWPELTAARPWAVEPLFVERPHYLPGGERAQRAEAHEAGFGLMAGLLLGDKKYVRFPDESGQVSERLYDLAQDPAEMHDAAGELPEDRVRLARLLDDWLAAHPAPAPSDGQPLSPERQRVLEALGYVHSVPSAPKPAGAKKESDKPAEEKQAGSESPGKPEHDSP
jgi:arylsulfatase A-like enzyme